MEYIVVCLSALAAAALTLFSGFGLGTLLLPVFSLFFPVALAVAATAVVHLANNIFKGYLLYKDADTGVALRFAVPAALGALAGALLLGWFAGMPPLYEYALGGKVRQVTLVNAVIAALLVAFSLFELLPGLGGKLSFDKRYIPAGGLVSGFFGGLSGLQGALRSAFLIKAGLTKESYVATSAMCAIVVDAVRISVYGATFLKDLPAMREGGLTGLVVAGTLAAFLGSLTGKRLMKKALCAPYR